MQQLLTPIHLVLPILFACWIVHFLDNAFNGELAWSGAIKPRRFPSLYNILTAPFLHADADHLAANSGAFLVLGSLLAWQGRGMFIAVSIELLVITGLILWLLSPLPVVGGSGVIFGYLGYLIMFGVTVDDGLPLIAGAIAFVVYSKMWIGVFPGDPRVSWLAHMAGFVAGMGLGCLLGLRAIGLGIYN